MAEANPPVDTPPATEPGAQPGALVDPFRNYNFKLLIDGVTEGHFTRQADQACEAVRGVNSAPPRHRSRASRDALTPKAREPRQALERAAEVVGEQPGGSALKGRQLGNTGRRVAGDLVRQFG